MKKETWLVVADCSKARIFKIESTHSLMEITVLEHPESRLHNLDLVTDKPGRAFESVGGARHGVGTSTTPKQHEFSVFAKDIANYLENSRNQGKFDTLYIIAGPTCLGLLRQNLDSVTAKLVKAEVDKDITHLSAEEIIDHLPFVYK